MTTLNKLLKVITDEDKGKIAGLLMDSDWQKRLLEDPTSPDAWMLDYVYDSDLRNALFEDDSN